MRLYFRLTAVCSPRTVHYTVVFVDGTLTIDA